MGKDELTHQHKIESPLRHLVFLQSYQPVRSCVVAASDLAHECGQDFEIDVVVIYDEDMDILRLVRWPNWQGMGKCEAATCRWRSRLCDRESVARGGRLNFRT